MKKSKEKKTKSIKFEKPTLDVKTLEEAAKAFAVKSGMGSC